MDNKIEVRKEIVHVTNPITGKSSDIVLHRDGTTDEKLAMIMLSPDATKEQKDSMISTWFFERGKENASFLAELYVSKGTHLKETQAFKRQMRWDFESFANTVVLLFQDLAEDIKKELGVFGGKSAGVIVPKGGDIKLYSSIYKIAQRLELGAELITKEREAITEARMKEKGYGVYIDKAGRAYSIFDDEIEDAVKNDKNEPNDKE